MENEIDLRFIGTILGFKLYVDMNSTKKTWSDYNKKRILNKIIKFLKNLVSEK